ncbi:hypothetical protein EW146_g3522 [Bondarzewia mesenterica]|uniref:Pectinesterase catalytic domain-containing protein n=1 Tax=Bondarzewia mesenterica TaxID=1095465 RepID=A0A4S4LYU1_9AGAM|nr:hypothetical protein EW146_g3522 [Bondarzewia mesenterica]
MTRGRKLPWAAEGGDVAPDEGDAIILIGAGEYHETINVTRKTSLTLLDWDSKYITTGFADDAQTAVLLVAPSYNASLIGAGPTGHLSSRLFGNVNFKAHNIDFQNRTLFQNVTLAKRACEGGNAAWKGTNMTDAPDNRYGVYVADSRIIRSPDAKVTTMTDGRCYLGRPWSDLTTSVYLRMFMDESIEPAGWTPFDSARPVIANTMYYAEYNSTGPGGNTTRVAVEHILTSEEAKIFTVDGVFLETPSWIDFEYKY